MNGYKILTHDWRSPLQGGSPVCDGKLPAALPPVELDTSNSECGAGWNFCESLKQAVSIAGFWPTGRPAKCLYVEAPSTALIRGNKIRSDRLTLVRLCKESEIKEAMRSLVSSWAGEKNVESLTEEQWAWYVALGRPARDTYRVRQGLEVALAARGLKWQLKQFNSTADAWDAWDAWSAWDARDARDAWDARAAWSAWDAWDARAAWYAWDAWDAWDARAAWSAWDARAAWSAWAARDAWDAWAARAARAALSAYSAVAAGWLMNYKKDLLTKGLRSSYYNGLGIAVPVGKNTLGWAMDANPREKE